MGQRGRGFERGWQHSEEGRAMQGYIIRRVFYALVSLTLLSITIFALVRITGDPAVLMAEPGAKEEDLQAIRREFGLDKPIVVQYFLFVKNLLRGDFGKSIYYRIPALDLYLQRLPASILLASVAMTISLIIGIPVGIFSAVRVNTWFDNFGKIFAILGLSLPSFWVGLLLILTLSVYLNWLPSSGSGGWKHLVMPAFSLGWVFTAAHMRLARSAMLEVLGSEYIKLARIKGLSERLVIAKHAFKNALIPVLTLAGINLVLMVNVAVVVESVFAWPGVGRLLFEGISFRDFPVVQTTVLMGGVMFVGVNLIVDILYAYIDPRIRYGN
jgi:ABC-type dipeptide/oligopeptide/nickel transport system permease component